MATITNSRISNLTTKPQPVVDRGLSEARIKVEKVNQALLVGDVVNGNIVHLVELPWDAKIHKIIVRNDELDSNVSPTATMKVGVYKIKPNDGTLTAVSDACYATGSTLLQNANTAGVDIAFAARTLDKIEKKVFEDAGLAAPPADGSLAVISATFTAAFATAAAGNIQLIVEYS